jgi:hypothetical protein
LLFPSSLQGSECSYHSLTGIRLGLQPGRADYNIKTNVTRS